LGVCGRVGRRLDREEVVSRRSFVFLATSARSSAEEASESSSADSITLGLTAKFDKTSFDLELCKRLFDRLRLRLFFGDDARDLLEECSAPGEEPVDLPTRADGLGEAMTR
jgi:hypothetical protein